MKSTLSEDLIQTILNTSELTIDARLVFKNYMDPRIKRRVVIPEELKQKLGMQHQQRTRNYDKYVHRKRNGLFLWCIPIHDS